MTIYKTFNLLNTLKKRWDKGKERRKSKCIEHTSNTLLEDSILSRLIGDWSMLGLNIKKRRTWMGRVAQLCAKLSQNHY